MKDVRLVVSICENELAFCKADGSLSLTKANLGNLIRKKLDALRPSLVDRCVDEIFPRHGIPVPDVGETSGESPEV